MKRWNRLFAFLLAAVCLFSLLAASASAAGGKTGRINFSDPSVIVGNTVTVTMTVTGNDAKLGAVTTTLSYDAGLLEFVSSSSGSVSGGDGVIRVFWYDTTGAGASSVSFSMVFKAKAVGTATITHAGTPEVATVDLDVISLTSSGSSKVTINAQPTASSNAQLGSLQISPGTLSPAFSAGTLEYTNSVPAGTTRLVVSAAAQDSKATVSVSGTSLTAGTNTTTITVTAEDGTTRKYIIRTTVPALPNEPGPSAGPELPPITVTVDGAERMIGESLEGVTLPEGYEEGTLQFQDRDIPVAVGTAKPLTLVWLTDADGENGAFYLYLDDAFYPLVEVRGPGEAYTILPPDDDMALPDGWAESAVLIDGQVTAAWRSEADPESGFVLLYVMNGAGKKGLYRYDTVEGTLQRYVPETGETAPVPSKDPEENVGDEDLAAQNARLENDLTTTQKELDRTKQFALLFLAALAVAVLALLILIVVMIAGGARRRRRARAEERERASAKSIPAEPKRTRQPVTAAAPSAPPSVPPAPSADAAADVEIDLGDLELELMDLDDYDDYKL